MDKIIKQKTVGSINGSVLYTKLPIDNTSWTKVITTALPRRAVLSIQNNTGQLVKLRHDSIAGFDGIFLQDGQERNYDADENFTIYAKSQTSNCVLDIEQIARD